MHICSVFITLVTRKSFETHASCKTVSRTDIDRAIGDHVWQGAANADLRLVGDHFWQVADTLLAEHWVIASGIAATANRALLVITSGKAPLGSAVGDHAWHDWPEGP